MAFLVDSLTQISNLHAQIEAAMTAYSQAVAVYQSVENGKVLDPAQVSMFMRIAGTDIRLPLPYTSQEVADTLAKGCNLLSTDIAQLWHQMQVVVQSANDHIAKSRAEFEAQEAAQEVALTAVPPAPTGVVRTIPPT